MRIGYLGPEGTFTQEALLSTSAASGHELIALPTIYDTVMAVHERSVDRALAPIENSIEGSVNMTLDTLAAEAHDVAIIGELVQPISYCLIARTAIALADVEAIVSHPQASGQCARFIRDALAGAEVVPANSTADAVRIVSESDAPLAALGTRLSAELYGCAVLDEGVADEAGNETRFVCLAPAGTEPAAGDAFKTSVLFWGAGDDSPGWLVRCLSEFASRGVNLTMIESRPQRRSLGHYMFFADLEGHAQDEDVAGAVKALQRHAQQVRVLGTYPAA